MEDNEPGALRRLLPRRPKDAIGLGFIAAGAGFIVINALFLQTGPHPAPIFANAPPPAATPSAPPTGSIPIPPPAPERRAASTRIPAATLPSAPLKANAGPVRPSEPYHDPIAELLEPANKTIAVQRALADFGYGQIKANGIVGPDTKAAIEKFERARSLPVTGQVSERLVRELSAMKGSQL